MLRAAPITPNLGMSQRRRRQEMAQAIEELRRFNPGRWTMITVSPNETKALIGRAVQG